MKNFKRIMTILVAATVVFCLAACGDGTEETDQVITRDSSVDETTTQASQTEDDTTESGENEDDAAEEAYSFAAEGVALTPGTAFDADELPDANDVYTVESCAIDGTDNVYMYDTFELTAFDEGNGEVIYSIYFTDANITTPEGLALGDDVSLVIELYGEDYEGDDSQMTYTKGDTELLILLQNDVVISIEYLLILE